jgi:stage IV sporulation protein FB
MGAGWPLGRILGFPVRVDPSALILLAVLAFSGAGIETAAIFIVVIAVSVLIHELGHALVIRRMGWDAEIVLHGFGGVTLSRSQPTPLQQVGISFAGPAMNLLLIAVGLLFRPLFDAGIIAVFLHYLVFVNAFLAVFNLLPIFPLDGGQAFRSLLLMVVPAKATLITAGIGMVLGVAVVAFALSRSWIFLSLIGVFLVAANFRALKGDEPATL